MCNFFALQPSTTRAKGLIYFCYDLCFPYFKLFSPTSSCPLTGQERHVTFLVLCWTFPFSYRPKNSSRLSVVCSPPCLHRGAPECSFFLFCCKSITASPLTTSCSLFSLFLYTSPFQIPFFLLPSFGILALTVLTSTTFALCLDFSLSFSHTPLLHTFLVLLGTLRKGVGSPRKPTIIEKNAPYFCILKSREGVSQCLQGITIGGRGCWSFVLVDFITYFIGRGLKNCIGYWVFPFCNVYLCDNLLSFIYYFCRPLPPSSGPFVIP